MASFEHNRHSGEYPHSLWASEYLVAYRESYNRTVHALLTSMRHVGEALHAIRKQNDAQRRLRNTSDDENPAE